MTEFSNNERPLISVITPYYNNESTVFRALDSLFVQTYDNIQFIFIDDGSATFDHNGITSYIEAHKQANIREFTLLQNGENLGTVKTINNGLAVAKGDYVFFLSADDCFYDERVLADWVAEFLRTGADVITAKRAVYDQDLETFLYYAPTKRQIRSIKEKSPQKLLERMTGENFIFGSCTAYSRKSYGYVGGKMDEQFRLIEDHPFHLRLLHAGMPILFFDRVVIRYRMGGISNFNRIDKDYFAEADSIFKIVALPLSKHKFHARYAYRCWKYKLKAMRDAERLRRKFRVKEKGCRRFFYRIVMLFRHPFFMIHRLFD